MAIEITQMTGDSDSSLKKAGAQGIHITASDRRFFSEQMALLLDTGTNLHAALSTLVRQSGKGKMKQLTTDVAEHISGGRSFSEALARHPLSFSTTFVNLVRAGEDGGFLPKVLQQLLDTEERRSKLKAQVMSALSYPMFLMAFSLGVVIFVLVAVFPKFATMFASIADKLPPTTKFLMATSEFMRANAISIAVALVALIVVIVQWMRSAQGRRIIDRFVVRTPMIRSVFVPLYLVQSLRVMGLSLGNGVSVIDTLTACREIVPNQEFTKFIDNTTRNVNDGAGLAIGFRNADFMPDIVKEMIATGEDTGSLPKVMNRVADYYEVEIERKLQAVARTAEPTMLIVMGVVVGLLVSSLILPIFQLSGSVG